MEQQHTPGRHTTNVGSQIWLGQSEARPNLWSVADKIPVDPSHHLQHLEYRYVVNKYFQTCCLRVDLSLWKQTFRSPWYLALVSTSMIQSFWKRNNHQKFNILKPTWRNSSTSWSNTSSSSSWAAMSWIFSKQRFLNRLTPSIVSREASDGFS